MKHSAYINEFVQYLWGDVLEDQCLSRELIDLLNSAGMNLEKAIKLFVEIETENDNKVMEPVFVGAEKCFSCKHFRYEAGRREPLSKEQGEALGYNLSATNVITLEYAPICHCSHANKIWKCPNMTIMKLAGIACSWEKKSNECTTP